MLILFKDFSCQWLWPMAMTAAPGLPQLHHETYLAYRNPYARETASIPCFPQGLDYVPANQLQHMSLEEAFQSQDLAADNVLCHKIN